jgi:hypothetical protein
MGPSFARRRALLFRDGEDVRVAAFRRDQRPPRGAHWGDYVNPAYDRVAFQPARPTAAASDTQRFFV